MINTSSAVERAMLTICSQHTRDRLAAVTIDISFGDDALDAYDTGPHRTTPSLADKPETIAPQDSEQPLPAVLGAVSLEEMDV